VATDAPPWFDLGRYAEAAEMDAADWMVNLLLRNWVRESNDPGLRSLIRFTPIIRRDGMGGFQLVLMLPARIAPAGFIGALNDTAVERGVVSLSLPTLYYFERQLPQPIREYGASRYRGGADKPPAGFESSLDDALGASDTGQQLCRFVRVNLALRDSELEADFRAFVKAEREKLAALGGVQPYREAAGLTDKPHGDSLKTLAGIGLLPFLDLDYWNESEGRPLSRFQLINLLGQEGNDAQLRKYTAIVRNDLKLRAWMAAAMRKQRPQPRDAGNDC